jgi:hypothetical protein
MDNKEGIAPSDAFLALRRKRSRGMAACVPVESDDGVLKNHLLDELSLTSQQPQFLGMVACICIN